VLNGTDQATASLPFVIEGGSVFMNKAFIKTAYITDLLIGATIVSQAYTQDGKYPITTINMATGEIIQRNAANSSTYTIHDQAGVRTYVNGQVRTRQGTW